MLLAGRNGSAMVASMKHVVCWWLICMSCKVVANELPTVAGPAMGTTYRVILGSELPGQTVGAVHRAIEQRIEQLEQATSTWRKQSDVSRFNRASADHWVPVSKDLIAIVQIAQAVHLFSGGAFDITIAPLLRLPQPVSPAARENVLRYVGMRHLDVRSDPPALKKTKGGVELDLGGIGPGYAVDQIGELLLELGSSSHLVELGGEIRAWGYQSDNTCWTVQVRGLHGPKKRVLNPGQALAFASSRPDHVLIDPRTGREARCRYSVISMEASTCAEADAKAVARLINAQAEHVETVRSPADE